MGLRQKINEKPLYTTLATVVLTGLAIGFMIWQFITPKPTTTFPNENYFSDDDGKTWYVDIARNIPPYDHNGHVAYRAALFKCADGKVFVGRLEQLDDETRAKIVKELSDGTPPLAAQYQYNSMVMVKRPGDTTWVQRKEGDSSSVAAYLKVLKVQCPDGSPARPVSPYENVRPSP